MGIGYRKNEEIHHKDHKKEIFLVAVFFKLSFF